MFKHILLIFTMCCAFCCAEAQTTWYRATQFAEAAVYNGNYIWSDWYSSSVKLKIDWDNDIVVIYSPKTQAYVITSVVRTLHTDSKGGKEAEFRVVDQDGDKGKLRLRFDPYGNSQIYIDFSNVAWVYTVVKM